MENSGKIKNFISKKIPDHMDLSQTAFTIVTNPVSRMAHFYIIVIQVGQLVKPDALLVWVCTYLEILKEKNNKAVVSTSKFHQSFV